MPGAKRLPTYELDFPATQKRKRHILAPVLAKLSMPPHFVPIDFNKQSMTEALKSALAAKGPTVIEAVVDSEHYTDTVYD